MSANAFHRTSVLALVLVLTISAASVSSQSGGPREGIEVHGDWTLTVRDPSGTVVARYAFKNELRVGFGADGFIAQLLAGSVTPGHLGVYFFGNPSTICNSNNAPCRIVESGALIGAESRDLTVEVPTSGLDAKKLVLRGSLRIPNAGAIERVGTFLSSCANTIAPASCAAGNENSLTEKILSSPVPVAANQTVDVVVVISFS